MPNICLSREQEQAEASRKEQKAGHELRPGDIVYSSWGYDQTNVDWYRVQRATAYYVWLAPLASVKTESKGDMCGRCVPGVELGKPERKCKAQGDRVTIGGYSGFRWDGKPRYFSTYA